MFGIKTFVCILAGIIVIEASIINRQNWAAKLPKKVKKFTGPIRYVVIHHSDTPEVCTTTDRCKSAMRSIQNFHMTTRNWDDIGYSFAVGGDGNIYEGRGYNVIGSHVPGYNSKSIGLVFIGNFQESPPPPNMVNAAKEFIYDAMSIGKLSSKYKLIGHRQAGSTACPGGALFNEIKTWPNWAKNP